MSRLNPKKLKPIEAEVYQALKTVIDPELHVNIVDLGLIYKIQVKDKQVSIQMTLTTPACPLAGTIQIMVREALAPLEPKIDPEITQLELVFDPPWTTQMMSPELQAEFGVDEWY